MDQDEVDLLYDRAVRAWRLYNEANERFMQAKQKLREGGAA